MSNNKNSTLLLYRSSYWTLEVGSTGGLCGVVVLLDPPYLADTHTHLEAEFPVVMMVGKGEDRCGLNPEGTATISITLVLLEKSQTLRELATVSASK